MQQNIATSNAVEIIEIWNYLRYSDVNNGMKTGIKQKTLKLSVLHSYL